MSISVDIPIPDVPGLSIDASYNFANNSLSAGVEEGVSIGGILNADVFIVAVNVRDVNGRIEGALPPCPLPFQ